MSDRISERYYLLRAAEVRTLAAYTLTILYVTISMEVPGTSLALYYSTINGHRVWKAYARFDELNYKTSTK